jgi:2-keto-4-pentenoate hydratase/2-oxohepta-3-ene-1,7-dioic acid hydratase in catechol pathway
VRLCTVAIDGESRAAVERDGERFVLDSRAGDLRELLALDGDALAKLEEGAVRAPTGARLVAPLRPPKVVAIGLNYLDHIREASLDPPESPLVFAKFPTAVTDPGSPIRIDPELTKRVDWEVELAVVIGRDARSVHPEAALDYVAGYTAGNDVSARDIQFADGQWVRGKSLDTFCPLGPVVVTADEIPDPQALRLQTRINGETVQDSSTAEMLFGVAELIAHCSRSFVLERGDVILTGTPWGCGEFMSPPRHMEHGDVVEVEVERIGILRNTVEFTA